MRPMVGHAYQLREPDYRYGTGTIRVVVAHVVEVAEIDNEPWWTIRGHVAVVMPTHLGPWIYREYLQVRESSLRGGWLTRRGPGWG